MATDEEESTQATGQSSIRAGQDTRDQAKLVLEYGLCLRQFLQRPELRCLTNVDNHTHISPAIGVGFRYTACNVIETLNLAVERYGKPECIRVDNGPEFISKELDPGAYVRGVKLDFPRPGKPTDNAFNIQSPSSLEGRNVDAL